MRKFSILLFSFFVAFSSVAQQPSDEELKKTNPFIRFDPSEVNLGTLAVNDINDDLGKIEVKVFNDGTQPLIINQVRACCGTQVQEWTNEPIAPGKSGVVKVYFRVAPRAHRISRTITITSNAANGNSLRIPILGEVVASADDRSVIELR